jgi:hypothetical protein
LVDDHVRVVSWLPPAVSDVGLAEMVTVGSGFTVTVTDAGLLVPPEPVQVMV